MRILVADDEPASAEALKDLLEIIGHQVVGPACDGAEAVRLARCEHPDLAILDIDMPRLSGLDAIDQITRSRPIPVIVLTAHCDAEFVDRAAELPVFNYLTKPAGADRIVPAIRMATARFREWSALNGRVSELSQKMDERKTIERAKGILMEVRGINEGDAYRLIQRESQQRSRSMIDVARSVVAAQGVFRRPAAPAPNAPPATMPVPPNLTAPVEPAA
ncbi:ANTAR domain-containing response regulator [Longimicrobium sp.]|uniref:ANTAR domain-containing response regulator n=1 Tax=Longimicrobium sp. TaxID=2029185 RepID=UPI002CBA2C60|nr:response regulator [Longimicrobium sp.]HSU15775.1 response regulator [Longimicrobium sp.]